MIKNKFYQKPVAKVYQVRAPRILINSAPATTITEEVTEETFEW